MAVEALRKRILMADDTQEERITIPEWDDVELLVRGMSGKERSKFMGEIKADEDEEPGVVYARMIPAAIVACVHDPDTDEPVFRSEDMDALLDKNAAVLERISQVALRLSGMGKEAEKSLGNE